MGAWFGSSYLATCWPVVVLLSYTATPMQRVARILTVWSLSLGAAVTTAAPAQQAPLFAPAADPHALSRLTVAVSAGAAAVVPGRPMVLRFDMVPAPGIHVYAPGNPDYIPVSVTLTPVSGVQAQPPVYPPAENYLFGELKETVKVYNRPFQVRQQIVVGRAAAKAGTSIT